MNYRKTTHLVEPGVSYFLEETLKNCNKEKIKYSNIIFNGFLVLVFVIIIGLIYYNKKNLTETQKKEKKELTQTYFLEQIKKLSEIEKKKLNMSITNLPKFENDFVYYDKKFI
uniref:Uncharacterized protein n=1 Tax=viral metagenome TaxID=1070528 RepID=A0A6C0C3N7_9ZZZZ